MSCFAGYGNRLPSRRPNRPRQPLAQCGRSAPDGELLVFLVVKRFSADEAAPFAFVRAVPLSDFVGLTEADDAVVAVESSATVFAAHCWLEGPVLPEMLVHA